MGHLFLHDRLVRLSLHDAARAAKKRATVSLGMVNGLGADVAVAIEAAPSERTTIRYACELREPSMTALSSGAAARSTTAALAVKTRAINSTTLSFSGQ